MSQYQSLVADHAAVIAPSDTTVISPTLGIYVGGAGNVTVTTLDGTVITFTAPPVGSIIPIRCSKVMAATTATLLIALW